MATVRLPINRGEDQPLLSPNIRARTTNNKGSDDEAYVETKYEKSPLSKYNKQDERMKVTMRGASRIIRTWPDNIAICCIIATIVCVLVIVYILMLESVMKSRDPRRFSIVSLQQQCVRRHESELKKRSSKNDEKTNVHLHIILNEDEIFDEDKYESMFVGINKHHPHHIINVYVLYNDTFDMEYKKNVRFANWESHQKHLDKVNFFDTSSGEEDKELVGRQGSTIGKTKHNNVNIIRSTFSNYFQHSPLRYRWRIIPPQIIPLTLKVLTIWERGGITMPWNLFVDKSDRYCEKKSDGDMLQAMMKNLKKTYAAKRKINRSDSRARKQLLEDIQKYVNVVGDKNLEVDMLNRFNLTLDNVPITTPKPTEKTTTTTVDPYIYYDEQLAPPVGDEPTVKLSKEIEYIYDEKSQEFDDYAERNEKPKIKEKKKQYDEPIQDRVKKGAVLSERKRKDRVPVQEDEREKVVTSVEAKARKRTLTTERKRRREDDERKMRKYASPSAEKILRKNESRTTEKRGRRKDSAATEKKKRKIEALTAEDRRRIDSPESVERKERRRVDDKKKRKDESVTIEKEKRRDSISVEIRKDKRVERKKASVTNERRRRKNVSVEKGIKESLTDDRERRTATTERKGRKRMSGSREKKERIRISSTYEKRERKRAPTTNERKDRKKAPVVPEKKERKKISATVEKLVRKVIPLTNETSEQTKAREKRERDELRKASIISEGERKRNSDAHDSGIIVEEKKGRRVKRELRNPIPTQIERNLKDKKEMKKTTPSPPHEYDSSYMSYESSSEYSDSSGSDSSDYHSGLRTEKPVKADRERKHKVKLDIPAADLFNEPAVSRSFKVDDDNTVDTREGISSSDSVELSRSRNYFKEDKAYIKHRIFRHVNVYSFPHKIDLILDTYGYYLSTKKPCHAFLGLLISSLQSAYHLQHTSAIVGEGLRTFCQGRRFNNCFGIELIN